MIRININISIVDMIDQNYRKPTNSAAIASECIVNQTSYNDYASIESEASANSTVEERKKFPSIERMFLDAFEVSFAIGDKTSYLAGSLVALICRSLTDSLNFDAAIVIITHRVY